MSPRAHRRAFQIGFRIGECHYVEPSVNTVTGPGGTTRLEPKVMQVLVCLVGHAGQVVTKQRLMQNVWPDTFVTDDVLTRAISELRRAFGDDVKEPRFIETIPKGGYRLIAGVAFDGQQDLAARHDAARGPVPAASGRHSRALVFTGIVLLAALAAGASWIAATRRGSSRPPRQPTLTQLTANPPHLPVTSARISPDGKYLAYADSTGIQVRVIDTGETQRIADTVGMKVYAWSGDGTKIRAAGCDTVTCTGWDLSLVGGTRRRSGAVWPATDDVIATADGSRLLKITKDSRDLSVDALDGSAPRHLFNLGLNGAASWSADGQRVFFTREPALSTVESISRAGGSSSLVFKFPEGQRIASSGFRDGLGSFLHLQDGRLLMLSSPSTSNAVAVWELVVDSRPGVARGSPRRLTEWRPASSLGFGRGVWLLNASSDGKRVVLESHTNHSDIYVARFDERQGRLLDTPKRLTTDERGSFPGAWTPDGKAILFNSGQAGSQDIFKQGLDAASAEPVVVSPGDQILPRMSSDGQWVLFYEPTGPSIPTQGLRIMRVPLAGGRPEQVLATAGMGWVRCSIAKRCVLFEQEKDRWVISSFDPVRGKGERLSSIPFNTRGEDLSGDGTAVAVVPDLDGSRPVNRIRIYSLRGVPQKDIVVKKAQELGGLDWAPTGSGFFSSNVMRNRSELLFIRPDGTSRVLWTREAPLLAVPSSDGTRLAIAGWTRQSNIWMLTDF